MLFHNKLQWDHRIPLFSAVPSPPVVRRPPLTPIYRKYPDEQRVMNSMRRTPSPLDDQVVSF